MNNKALTGACGIFLATLGISWLSHGTGVVRNDIDANIYIPEQLTMPLQVKAAYDGERIFFRYRWPAEQPSIYHDVSRYEGGAWKRYGESMPGPQPQGLYEDRVTMLVDDGSVPEFARYGGYVTVGDGMRFFTAQASEAEVKAHPYLGEKKGQTEVGKHLPETRSDPGNWRSVLPEEQLQALRASGYFLDLWHWRAHRSSPVGASDDQVIAEARYGDEGAAPFFTNWDAERKQPKLMFNPELNKGAVALAWDDLVARRLGFDDVYYLREDMAVPFDAAHPWREGDTLPRRVLRAGKGSRADISVHGKAEWHDGYWDVTLVRAMDTGNPLDDKIFQDMRAYTVAFAVHRDSSGSRWHYVSMPVRLGLGRQADMHAARFSGEGPDWNQAWHDVTLFYPGQVSWPLLNSAKHAGAKSIASGVPVRTRHSEKQLAHYGVESEFRAPIQKQWLYTMLAGALLIVGFGVAVNLLLKAKEG